MGADPSTFAAIYSALADKFDQQPEEVKKDRRQLAKTIRKVWEKGDSSDCDFNDDDLDCYEELIALGIAKRCKYCKRGLTRQTSDDHGEDVCDGDG